VTPEDRATLARLADQLIPRSGEMPSASEVGVHLDGVDHVLSVRPDLVEPLRVALSAVDVHGLDPAVFAALGEIVAGAYYLVPEVKDRIGYHGRRAVSVETARDVDADLLRPVVERGPIYRADPRDL